MQLIILVVTFFEVAQAYVPLANQGMMMPKSLPTQFK